MADAIIFPGTVMEVFEKYSDSRRLDHPDVADVRKTTFAKGVITDFKTAGDDPLLVESMAKVKIDDGEESGFIPIFYHPKELYWDDEEGGIKAQDFDEAQGNFKRAWMSFRVDDEVIVMLQEGEPVAIIGFADGVPRLGEDIIKIKTESVEVSFNYVGMTADDAIIDKTWPEAFFRISQIKMHEEGDKALDGADLKLLKKADYYEGPEEQWEQVYWLDSWGDWPGPEPTPGFDTPYGTFVEDIGTCQWGWLGLGNSYEDIGRISLWLVTVGPILYAIFGMWFNSRSIHHTGYMMDSGDNSAPYIYGGYRRSGQNVYGYERLLVKAGLYTEKTKDAVIASLQNFAYSRGRVLDVHSDWWPVTPPEMVYQEDLSRKFQWLCHFDQKDHAGVEWLTRPHTKAELQDAGLWPAGRGE